VSDPFPKKQFIETSHVKFLESAGARVVPIDFTLDPEQLKTLLSQINGVYIPGDQKTLVGNGDYAFTKTVQQILLWAQTHNE
jgi:hypothetical protein